MKIVAINGSYRPEGVITAAVDGVLAAARERGAETQTFRLADQHIEFCTNCRECMQPSGPERGACIFRENDDMESILQAIEQADGLVIGAPVNLGDVNALTRLFMERCVGFGYWPWNTQGGPKMRQPPSRRAALISSSGAPGLLNNRLFGSNAAASLRRLAELLGARPIGILRVGFVLTQDFTLSERARLRARELGARLAS